MAVSLAGYRPPRCRGERTRQGEWLGGAVNAKICIRNVERLSGALQRAARTSGAEKIRNAVALHWRGIVEVAFVEERELSFHFVG